MEIIDNLDRLLKKINPQIDKDGKVELDEIDALDVEMALSDYKSLLKGQQVMVNFK